MSKDKVSKSKFLSYVLRHQPEAIGLTLDPQGWANLSELIAKTNEAGQAISLDDIKAIVKEDAKGRFSISEDGLNIRAVQGHSLKTVDLKLAEVLPPTHLLHGTAQRFIDSILKDGLLPKERQYVHLTESATTAKQTGMRYGKPVVLVIDSQKMQADGYLFYRAENDVWLTKSVPPVYISFLE